MQLKKEKKEKLRIPEMESGSSLVVQTIKTDRAMKVGRIVLWAAILFLLLRGVVSIVSPSSESRLEGIVSDYQKEATLRETAQIEAAAFAERFIYEYYTFTGKMNSDYEQRIGRYYAKNVEVKAPVAGQVAARALQSSTTEIHYISERQYDVDVHVIVTYTPFAEGQLPITKDLYLRVPLAADKKGQYAVTSLPAYIPGSKIGSVDPVISYTGEQVQSKEIAKIKDTLHSFFVAYYGGTDTEVSYYLAGGSDIETGIGGTVVYQKIDYISVYQDSADDYLVDATITVTDELQPMQQRLFMRLQKAKGRYYIKTITTRAI